MKGVGRNNLVRRITQKHTEVFLLHGITKHNVFLVLLMLLQRIYLHKFVV